MATKSNFILRTQSGSALVIALIMMIVITVIGLASSYTSIFEIIASGNKRASTNAFYGADAQAVAIIANTGNFPKNANNSIPQTTLSFGGGGVSTTGNVLDTGPKKAPVGRGMGATASYLHFEIRAIGTDSSGTKTTVVEEVVRVLPTAQ
jgi:FlaG/FlaF family flagellin (archaellin)